MNIMFWATFGWKLVILGIKKLPNLEKMSNQIASILKPK